jgi:hypothetical protein
LVQAASAAAATITPKAARLRDKIPPWCDTQPMTLLKRSPACSRKRYQLFCPVKVKAMKKKKNLAVNDRVARLRLE